MGVILRNHRWGSMDEPLKLVGKEEEGWAIGRCRIGRQKIYCLTIPEYLNRTFSDLPEGSVNQLRDIIEQMRVPTPSTASGSRRKRKVRHGSYQGYDSYRPHGVKRLRRQATWADFRNLLGPFGLDSS